MQKASSEIYLTYKQIAEIWGKSTKTVGKWGMESAGKDGSEMLFSLEDVVRCVPHKHSGTFDYERTRKEKELADKLEMQNEEFRKSLISVEDVDRIWGDIADNVKSKMLGITSQVSKILAQNSTTTIPFEDVKRIENAIDGQIKSALSELSRTRA